MDVFFFLFQFVFGSLVVSMFLKEVRSAFLFASLCFVVFFGFINHLLPLQIGWFVLCCLARLPVQKLQQKQQPTWTSKWIKVKGIRCSLEPLMT